MNKSLIVLLIVRIFFASVMPEECNQQSTKEVVCELQKLVKQQSKPSIGETDFAPMMNAISSFGDAGTEERKAMKSDLDELRKNVAMKSDLEQKINELRKEVAMKSDLDQLRKDVAMKSDLEQLKKGIVKEVVEAIKPQYKSCQEIYADGQRENKAYELSLEGGKTPVYCHMDAIQGCGSGGFTLVMKIDGNKRTFHYNSALWTNKDVYNDKGGSSGFNDQETKLPTYSQTPFKKVCLGMKVGDQTKFISISKKAESLYSLIADGQYRASSLGRDAWKSLISDSSLQRNCNKEGFNAVGARSDMARARIGITSNEQNECSSNDSRLGFGTGGRSEDSTTCGNVARHGGDNGDKTLKAIGYILVQ